MFSTDAGQNGNMTNAAGGILPTWLQEDEWRAWLQHSVSFCHEAWKVREQLEGLQAHHSLHTAVGLRVHLSLPLYMERLNAWRHACYSCGHTVLSWWLI